jgi:hypothetical protein
MDYYLVCSMEMIATDDVNENGCLGCVRYNLGGEV